MVLPVIKYIIRPKTVSYVYYIASSLCDEYKHLKTQMKWNLRIQFKCHGRKLLWMRSDFEVEIYLWDIIFSI